MPPVEFEPTISAGERPQTYALDRAPTTTGGAQWYVHLKTLVTRYGFVGTIFCVKSLNGT
jgi:hypothetical protein